MVADVSSKAALLIVDIQNDFCPGGALGVDGGDLIIDVLNRYSGLFEAQGLPIFLTRDWHPHETSHFKTFGGIWPVHCVMGTKGAEFHPWLHIPAGAVVISKGMDPHRDDYSALHGRDDEGTPLPELLRRLGIERIFIGGLATDYCVKYTALEALKLGIAVIVLEDAVKGVNLKGEDSETALHEVEEAGAETAKFPDVKSWLNGARLLHDGTQS